MTRSDLVPWLLVSSLSLGMSGLAGCSRPAEPKPKQPMAESSVAPKDVCQLLTAEELEKILGERPANVQKSTNTSGGFTISQCLFNMPTYRNSISVQVTRRAPGPKGVDPRAFLERKIEDREKGEDGEKEGERPLDFVPGLGDKAIWIGTAVGGTFYVLKDDFFVRISLGSLKEPARRREKAIEIAKLVMNRM